MPVDERRRMELFDRLSAALGEEAATTMLELLPPSRRDVATKDDVSQLSGQLEAVEHRLSAIFERRIADSVTAQTRTLVFSQLGSLLAISALAFGLGLAA